MESVSMRRSQLEKCKVRTAKSKTTKSKKAASNDILGRKGGIVRVPQKKLTINESTHGEA
jgi:hypothetical protein